MSELHSWELSYPPALRGYRIDEGTLPAGLDLVASEARAAYENRTAFTLVLPTGASASLSFAHVDVLSDSFATYLMTELGLAAGDVVAIQMPNSLHYPISAFGTWKAGAILTNVNPLYTERELVAQLKDCGAKVLVATRASRSSLCAAARECGVHILLADLGSFFSEPETQAVSDSSKAEDVPFLPETISHSTFETALQIGRDIGPVPHRRHEVALYQYTGGTTGRSKGAQLSHRNILSAMRMTEDSLAGNGGPLLPSDVMLTVLPLYHVFAFVINFLVSFRVGARNILIPSPRPLSNLRPAFEQFSPTWMTGVDTLYAGLMAEPWLHHGTTKLRFSVSGGTALRQATGERWRETVGPMLEGYGMTETSCVVSLSPPDGSVRAGSVGLPMPGSEVKVVDGEGCTLPPGEPGELLVRGPHIMSGYLNKPDEDAVAFANGWLRTGDVVVMTPDGYITIVDRLKDLVLVSGFNVYPNEVEAVIAAHPDVVEVAVVGAPDETTGEAVCAYVVSRRPELTAAEVVQYCRTQLTAYKVPKRVIFRDQLPKSPVGKILRALLRAG